MEGFRRALRELLPAERLRERAPMREYTTFRIGGPADVLAEPASVGELSALLRLADTHGVPKVVIGLGSNLLVRDGGVRGLVIRIGEAMAGIRYDGEATLTAGAGAALKDVAAAAARYGLAGLEFAEGIPGSVGGAVAMNAGAYGGEMSAVVRSGLVVDGAGSIDRQHAAALGFGYRRSAVQDKAWVVVEAKFSLSPGDPAAIQRRMAELAVERRSKQPLSVASAGSVFKRPAGHYVGPLIESAGLKGLRVGDAQVSPLHAGFIVNVGEATCAQVLRLVELVQAEVRRLSGVSLELELRVLGED